MMRKNDWDRYYISLLSEAQPPLRNRDGDNLEYRVWRAMEKLGGKRLTLEEIVKECERRGYRAVLSIKFTVRESVIWQLRNFAEQNPPIVQIEF